MSDNRSPGGAATRPLGEQYRGPLVVMAASAGGLEALTEVLSRLPAEFPAPIVVVQHLDRTHRSALANILDRRSDIPVKQADDGEPLRAKVVFVAPPDHHVLVTPEGTLQLTMSEAVHFVRPAADVLFESAANSFGPSVIAVVLTGAGTDGAKGVRAIKRGGGTVLAQDEASSKAFGMPGAAIATHDVDAVVPLTEVAGALVELLERAQW